MPIETFRTTLEIVPTVTQPSGLIDIKEIPIVDLFDGRLERYDVREHIEPGITDDRSRCLTDGEDRIWAFVSKDGTFGGLELVPGNKGYIIAVLERVLKVEFVEYRELQNRYAAYFGEVGEA